MENELYDKIKTEAAAYGKAVGQVYRLRLIGLISRLLGLFLLIFTVVLCALAIFTFGAVAAIDAMSAYMPVWAAALIVSSAYLLIIVVAVVCRRPLFIHPFIALLSKQLIRTQEELDMETLKAENDVNLQTVRIETRIENATRELDFYVSLFNRVWNWLAGKLRR